MGRRWAAVQEEEGEVALNKLKVRLEIFFFRKTKDVKKRNSQYKQKGLNGAQVGRSAGGREGEVA
jgi:hypothetical protein